MGRLKMELWADICPKTCENFRQFCTGEHRKNGVPQGYKDCKIHRIERDFIVQGGDFVRVCSSVPSCALQVCNMHMCSPTHRWRHPAGLACMELVPSVWSTSGLRVPEAQVLLGGSTSSGAPTQACIALSSAMEQDTIKVLIRSRRLVPHVHVCHRINGVATLRLLILVYIPPASCHSCLASSIARSFRMVCSARGRL